MAALEERKARLVELTRNQTEEPPMLHLGLAEVYRRKVEKLTEALNKEELRSEAAEILRSTIQTIRLVPENGELTIELVGELAGILALGQEKSLRPFGPGARQMTLVAGAGSQCRYGSLSRHDRDFRSHPGCRLILCSRRTPQDHQEMPAGI